MAQDMMKLMEDWKGFNALSEINKGTGYEQKLKETIDLLANAQGLPSHKHEYLIREALTTSDFPYLFGDVLDRQVLAQYVMFGRIGIGDGRRHRHTLE